MNFIIRVIVNLCQVFLGTATIAWCIMVMALFGQSIISISTYDMEAPIMLVVALILSPWFLKYLGKCWQGLAGYKRQMI